MDTKIPAKPCKLSNAEKKRIEQLKQAGHGCTTIGRIVERDPATVYRYLVSQGLQSQDFSDLKRQWSDVTLAQAAKIRRVKGAIIDCFNEEDLSTMSAKEKAAAIRDLSVAEGATIDQGPKIVIQQQFNYAAFSADSDQVHGRIEEIRAKVSDLVSALGHNSPNPTSIDQEVISGDEG